MLNIAVGKYPGSVEAGSARADALEGVGDWESAWREWERVRALAGDQPAGASAETRSEAARDQLVGELLRNAEATASEGDYSKAMEQLGQALQLEPPEHLARRLDRRYQGYLADWFVQRISAEATGRQWDEIVVTPFIGGRSGEGRALMDRMAVRLNRSRRESGTAPTRLVDLSLKGVQSLLLHGTISADELDRIGVVSTKTAIVFGEFGDEISGRVLDLEKGVALPLLQAPRLNPVRAIPSRGAFWDLLPRKDLSSPSLTVEVWTKATRYHVGEEVTFHIRASRDCWIVLLDLQTSGEVHVLFPNSYQRDNFVRANDIHAIGSAASPFAVEVTGPAGVEGVKVIASRKPIGLGIPVEGQAFVSARTASGLEDLSEKILKAVGDLPEEEWDVDEWTFEILPE